MKSISKNGLKLIKKHEGFRNHPYKDVKGIPTIGYGNTFYEDGTKVTMEDHPITKKRGEELLKIIVNKFEVGVWENLEVEVNQNQFDALVSFAYNVGVSAFKYSTLLKKINNDPNDFEAIKKQFKRWNKSGGKVYKGLEKRRNQEAYLYETPVDKNINN